MILKHHIQQPRVAVPSKRDHHDGGLSNSAIGAIAGSIVAVVLILIIVIFCCLRISSRRRDLRKRHQHLRQRPKTRLARNKKMRGPLRDTQFSWKWKISESGPSRTASNTPSWDYPATGRKEFYACAGVGGRIPGGPKHPTYRAVPEGRMERLPRMKRVFPAPVFLKGAPQVKRTVGVVHADYQERRDVGKEEEEYSDGGYYKEKRDVFKGKRVYKPRRS